MSPEKLAAMEALCEAIAREVVYPHNERKWSIGVEDAAGVITDIIEREKQPERTSIAPDAPPKHGEPKRETAEGLLERIIGYDLTMVAPCVKEDAREALALIRAERERDLPGQLNAVRNEITVTDAKLRALQKRVERAIRMCREHTHACSDTLARHVTAILEGREP